MGRSDVTIWLVMILTMAIVITIAYCDAKEVGPYLNPLRVACETWCDLNRTDSYPFDRGHCVRICMERKRKEHDQMATEKLDGHTRRYRYSPGSTQRSVHA